VQQLLFEAKQESKRGVDPELTSVRRDAPKPGFANSGNLK
jgi:hypothetical protein